MTVSSDRVSVYRVLRFIFVVFFLYLTGDAIYRWSGARYYLSFSEFLTNAALVSILWSFIALTSAMVAWLVLSGFGWLCKRTGWKVGTDNLIVFSSVLILLVLGAWAYKRFVWTNFPSSFNLELTVFSSIALISLVFTWLFRNKTGSWIDIIQDRITPLVWLFCIWIFFSVTLVGYQMWIKQTDVVLPQKETASLLSGNKHKNIILVTFDALTAEDMSLYGYHRQTTPFIDKWAENASVFLRAEAASNWTTPSVASLMTGKQVWSHKLFNVGAFDTYKSDVENMALVLKEHGYYNIALVTNHYATVDRLGISKSFDIADPAIEFCEPKHLFGSDFGYVKVFLSRFFGKKFKMYDWIVQEDFIFSRIMSRIFLNLLDTMNETEVPPHIAFNKLITILNNSPSEPYFAWVHLYPPHDPYLPPRPFMGMFEPSQELRTFNSSEELRSRLVYKGYYTPDMQPYVDMARGRYDEFIRYCDSELENFIKQLSIHDKLGNTVIIVSSDHGDSFGHGFYQHGAWHFFEQVTHIPLIIKEPDQIEGKIINELVGHTDITATILDIADIPKPSWIEGRSLEPLMHGKEFEPKPVFSMNFQNNLRGHKITYGTIAVWEGNYKLIYYIESNTSLLFDLKHDPYETKNVFDSETETGQRLLALIKNNLNMANEKIE